jgi:hypothetical protein
MHTSGGRGRYGVGGEILKVVLLGAIACGLGIVLTIWLSGWISDYWMPPSGHECVAALLLIVVSLFGFWYCTTKRVRPILEEERRRLRGTCGVCGYNLTGNVSGTCPECGTPVPAGDDQLPVSGNGSND